MELAILGIFTAALLLCIVSGHSILYALLIGYCLFFIYGLIKKFSTANILKMSWTGIKTVKNILITFVLIGMLTAVWRDCGTIPFIIYHSSKMIIPSVFILMTFLLCCLVSFLTGTSFGAAATLGVICMTLSNAMGINPAFTGGAILSGAFFGDRCSPMSTSALLVSELTKTDIYVNIKNMVRTSLVPFIAACALYFLLGIKQSNAAFSSDIWNLFLHNYNLNVIVVLPALLIIVLCVLRIKVRYAMIASILAAGAISVVVQHTTFLELLRLLLNGFRPEDERLYAMMNGGGIASMFRVMAIVSISSCYAGIFEGTGLLNGIKSRIVWLGGKITVYGSLIVSSVLTCMIACNQTLGIMLTHYLYKDITKDREQLAVNLENTVVVIAALVPWSIACAVPLATTGAPIKSVLAAFYLILLPVWNFFGQKKNEPR